MALTSKQLGHLQAARRYLAQLGHTDPESFAEGKDDNPSLRKQYVSVESMLFELLKLVRSELARSHTHVGYTVLEIALFNAIRTGGNDPVAEVVGQISALNLDAPGFLLYPLHSLGLLHPLSTGLLQAGAPLELVLPDIGLAVSSQFYDRSQLEGFLGRAATALGVVGQVSSSDLRHYLENPVCDWLLKNPMLMVRIRSLSMGPRENQPAYVRALNLRTAFLILASVLVPPREDSRMTSLSTHARNNDETLDFKHYFVFESPGVAAQDLRSERVPMNLRRPELMQLADLNIDLDPAAWQDPRLQNQINALMDAIIDLEELQAEVAAGDPAAKPRSKMSGKLAVSLHWFRRGFAAFADERESVVSLAVAFEALLSDGFSQGITPKMVRRAGICVAGAPDAAALEAAVSELFNWRGAIVHQGETNETIDLLQARQAYTRCFVTVVERLRAATGRKTVLVDDLIPVGPRQPWWKRLLAWMRGYVRRGGTAVGRWIVSA